MANADMAAQAAQLPRRIIKVRPVLVRTVRKIFHAPIAHLGA